jgi:flagellar motor switch protein FliN/FliY
MSSSPSSSSSNAPPSVASESGRLQDVMCRVEVVLGTGTVSVRECLALRRNKVVQLSQVAGSDLQVRVNGIPIANSEVMIVDDSTAVRLTDILAPPSVSRNE